MYLDTSQPHAQKLHNMKRHNTFHLSPYTKFQVHLHTIKVHLSVDNIPSLSIRMRLLRNMPFDIGKLQYPISYYFHYINTLPFSVFVVNLIIIDRAFCHVTFRIGFQNLYFLLSNRDCFVVRPRPERIQPFLVNTNIWEFSRQPLR